MKQPVKSFGNSYREERVELRPGLERVTLVYNDQTMLCSFFIKRGAVLEPHRHDAVQSGLIIRGRLCFHKDDGDHLLEAGDGYLFAGGERHGLTALEDTEFIECFTPSREEYKVEAPSGER